LEFVAYFPNVFTPDNFLALCLGTAGGLILGALPGLSPTMAVALLIPFTFHMAADTGLVTLGAVYTATVAGGAVSAILLKIPGAPANIATVLDGHAMARKGEAASALRLSFLASGVGGILGILVLIFFTPLLAKVALDFGPSHLFWLALVGVVAMAALGGESVVKGLIAGFMGLWLSTIGYDDIHGTDRFAFSEHLIGGVNVIAALVGLFAIPQVIEMLLRAARDDGETTPTKGGGSLWHSVRLLVSKPWTMLVGGVSGIVIGIIPGAGGQIAGLFAYDQARKISRHPETFGDGEPEGVIAAETANNAMVGPSLAPLLTLSVPGSPTAAVLLGGLLIHGIFPGPNLFRDYPEVVWTFVDSMFVGQFLMVALGLALSKIAARVIALPSNYLAAGILTLAVFGTYSVQHSYSDVLVMAALGVGMWFLERRGYPAAPLALGVVLGPIVEDNFTQGVLIAEAEAGALAYFCSGALNAALIGLVLLMIFSNLWLSRRRRARSAR
jgi:putative tricarboxylic transport membrane protein